MAFVGLSAAEMPANRAKQSHRETPGVGPGTAQYGRVWPNEWPNGDLLRDIERRCVAPVTIEPATGAPAGRASRCRRAQRTRSTAAADGMALRVLDASLPGGWSQVPRHPIASVPGPGYRTRCRPRTGARAFVQPGCELDLERRAGDRFRRRSSSRGLGSCSSSLSGRLVGFTRDDRIRAIGEARWSHAAARNRSVQSHGQRRWRTPLWVAAALPPKTTERGLDAGRQARGPRSRLAVSDESPG